MYNLFETLGFIVFLIEKKERIEDKRFSKFSLLTYDDMRYTKNRIEYTRKDNSIATKSFYYTDVDRWKTRAFIDAFVMTYFSNILRRDKNSFGIDELYDIYGNRIAIFATNKLRINIAGKVIPEEIEHLYDRLIFEIIKKVRTYGEDMEIGR